MNQVEETGKQKAQSTSEPEEVYLTHAPCLITQKGSQARRHYSTEEQGTQATALNTLVGVVQSLSRVQLFSNLWTAACQASLCITNSWSLLKLMSIELMMPSDHHISAIPFSSCLQTFPASGSFQMSPFFASHGQSIGASASTSVLPMNIQD